VPTTIKLLFCSSAQSNIVLTINLCQNHLQYESNPARICLFITFIKPFFASYSASNMVSFMNGVLYSIFQRFNIPRMPFWFRIPEYDKKGKILVLFMSKWKRESIDRRI